MIQSAVLLGLFLNLLIIGILTIIIQMIPLRFAKIIVALISIGLTLLAAEIAPNELQPLGIVTRSREPNYNAYYLACFTAILSPLNLILVYKSTNINRLQWPCMVIAGLIFVCSSQH